GRCSGAGLVVSLGQLGGDQGEYLVVRERAERAAPRVPSAWTARAVISIGALAAVLGALVIWFARWTHPTRPGPATASTNGPEPPPAVSVGVVDPPAPVSARVVPPAPLLAPATSTSTRSGARVRWPPTPPEDVVQPWEREGR